MRYTTIIDLSELPIYQSKSVRLLYLHLCLRAGYHKENQDIITDSLTRIARDTGMTVSAVRCALRQLIAASLAQREGTAIRVIKFVQPVLAAKRVGKMVTDGSEEANKRGHRIDFLNAELEKMRRWYADAASRGDEESCNEISKEAAKMKRELKQLQG